MTIQQIEELALQLSADERAELAERLWESLHSPMPPELEKKWAEEIERRIELYKQGRMPMCDAREAIQELHEMLHTRS